MSEPIKGHWLFQCNRLCLQPASSPPCALCTLPQASPQTHRPGFQNFGCNLFSSGSWWLSPQCQPHTGFIPAILLPVTYHGFRDRLPLAFPSRPHLSPHLLSLDPGFQLAARRCLDVPPSVLPSSGPLSGAFRTSWLRPPADTGQSVKDSALSLWPWSPPAPPHCHCTALVIAAARLAGLHFSRASSGLRGSSKPSPFEEVTVGTPLLRGGLLASWEKLTPASPPQAGVHSLLATSAAHQSPAQPTSATTALPQRGCWSWGSAWVSCRALPTRSHGRVPSPGAPGHGPSRTCVLLYLLALLFASWGAAGVGAGVLVRWACPAGQEPSLGPEAWRGLGLRRGLRIPRAAIPTWCPLFGSPPSFPKASSSLAGV